MYQFGVGVLRHPQPGETAVRLIQHVHLHFVPHYALLVLQVLLSDSEAFHAIGFGPQRRFEFVRRQQFEVVGEVETRRSVEHPAICLHQPDELHLAEILGALEHHVLKQVREAGAIFGLDPEADAIVDGRNHGGRCGIRRQDHSQPVWQLVISDGHSEASWIFGGERRERGTGGQQQSSDRGGRMAHRKYDAPYSATVARGQP